MELSAGSPPLIVVCYGTHGAGVKSFVKFITEETGASYIDSAAGIARSAASVYGVSDQWWDEHWNTNSPLHRFAPRNVGYAELHGRTPLRVIDEIERKTLIDYIPAITQALSTYNNAEFCPHVIIQVHAETIPPYVQQAYNMLFINVFRLKPTSPRAHLYVRNNSTLLQLKLHAIFIVNQLLRAKK